MGSEISTREQPSTALVTREYLHEKQELVRKLYAPDASDLEFEHFIEVAATRGLNPLAKQLYCISRKSTKTGKMEATIQTGIDGFRLIALRTGEYRGQVGPFWCGAEGAWVDVWLDTTAKPAAAKVGVLREGFDEPVFGIVTWSAYADERSHFWSAAKGVNQLAKCAESLALRKAFPEELSGLYTSEEMGQADRGPAGEAIWAARWRELKALATAAGIAEDALKSILRGLGLKSAKGLADAAAYGAAVRALTGEAEPEEDEPFEGEVVPDPEGDAAVAEEIGDEVFSGRDADPDAGGAS